MAYGLTLHQAIDWQLHGNHLFNPHIGDAMWVDNVRETTSLTQVVACIMKVVVKATLELSSVASPISQLVFRRDSMNQAYVTIAETIFTLGYLERWQETPVSYLELEIGQLLLYTFAGRLKDKIDEIFSLRLPLRT
ncbi:hypothetical protein BTUL_0190g00070 [Botrytis tulipae]|uniref:Uncharacterized protein n=1 Tax=Botrytis tulipae TaxID=87230 RepID=A0A4Z1EDV9_9HELO|nr:hypothetical protein BTUL_0190g00070 [Botrytis tulipae]